MPAKTKQPNLIVVLRTLTNKKSQLDHYRPLPPELVRNLDEWFKVELTYTSNAIEGNTLTRQETALVLGKGLTVQGKTLKEHLEATNHAEALDLIIKFINHSRQQITEADILDIHRLVLQKIDQENAGRYRRVAVRIAGVIGTPLPNPMKVPSLMTDYVNWLRQVNPDHPVKIAADAHLKLMAIHPFVDGNGRTARLIMNLLLIQTGYPPAIIDNQRRLAYINAIEKAQKTGHLEGFYRLIYQAVEHSLNIYLKAVKS